jgi:hypothetical protein
MSSPIQFYRSFQSLMREHGIRHVLTSGMACVEYGIQQNTKDTDWIIHPEDLDKLVALLFEHERGLTGNNWRVSYRALFGAPFLREYHRGGWTTHIAIHDEADSPEHHLDFFGHPPRVRIEEVFADAYGGLASRGVVAQMKKTDRDKDWPFVNGLAMQACLAGDSSGLLHLRELEILKQTWNHSDKSTRTTLALSRPLLNCLDSTPNSSLERLLLIERSIWECVNRERYRIYQHEWKEFYRRWQRDAVGEWPTAEPFHSQHQRVCEAVNRFALPPAPIAPESVRQALYQNGIARTVALTAATPVEIGKVAMPLETILP